MTDTDAALETIVTTLARRWCVLLVLVVVAGLAGAGSAWGEEPAKLVDPDVEEMAGALGFADSHAPGFWEALTQAVADQRTQAEDREKATAEQAAAERAAQANQVILDAATYGRRTVVTSGRLTSFTEYIPPASGDIIDGTVNIRMGSEEVHPDGSSTIVTKYFKPHSTDALGVVVTEVKDDVETVTKVIEYEPESIDVKVGDSRPVPPAGSSAAGKKPHTFDPKADGSYGQASGGQPNGGAKLAQSEEKVYETVIRDKAGNDRRQDFDPIKLPDGRTLTPFLETKLPRTPEELEGALPFRSGYKIEHPEWDDAIAQITVYFDKEGKVAGVVAEVIGKDGISEIVGVTELIPGSLGGLKKGDKRPARDKPGDVATTWDPKPKASGSSGAASAPKTPGAGSSSSGAPSSSGGSQSDGGQKGSSGAETGRVKHESLGGGAEEKPAASGSGTTGGAGEAPAQTETKPSNVKWGIREHDLGPDGNKYTGYRVTNPDGSTEHRERRPSARTGPRAARSTRTATSRMPRARAAGPTSRPARSDCARFAALAELFFCSAGASGGSDCGQPPEGTQANPHAGPGCEDQIHETSVSGGTAGRPSR